MLPFNWWRNTRPLADISVSATAAVTRAASGTPIVPSFAVSRRFMPLRLGRVLPSAFRIEPPLVTATSPMPATVKIRVSPALTRLILPVPEVTDCAVSVPATSVRLTSCAAAAVRRPESAVSICNGVSRVPMLPVSATMSRLTAVMSTGSEEATLRELPGATGLPLLRTEPEACRATSPAALMSPNTMSPPLSARNVTAPEVEMTSFAVRCRQFRRCSHPRPPPLAGHLPAWC